MRIEMNAMEVRTLCIKNDWFTNGDNAQYTRLFERVDDGAEIDEIATIIWICSVNADKDDIMRQLTKTVKKECVEDIKKITLKNSDKWQTIEITYDGLNFNQKFIQHGVMLIILSQMESEIGDADETVSAVLSYMTDKGFNVYGTDGKRVTSIREVVYAIDELIE